MPPFRDALIVFNPQARRARHLLNSGGLQRFREVLHERGVESTMATTQTPEAAEQAARGAVRQKTGLVIACGGDGTLNAVVNGLAGSTVPMAILPAGTANILAKEIGLPSDPQAAAGCIAEGSLRRIALGSIITADGGIRYFLSVAGAGPDGAIVRAVHENGRLKRRAGILAFWVEGFRQFVRYRFPRFRVIAGDREIEATLVVVGRTRHYGGPLRITTAADLYGRDFEIMACTTRSRFRYLSYIPLALAGGMRAARDAIFLRTDSLRCEPSERPAALVQGDGEPAGQLPAEFRVVPDALTLVIPSGQGQPTAGSGDF